MRIPALTRAISCACLIVACLANTPAWAGEPAANAQAAPIPEAVEAYARALKIVSKDANAGAGVEGLLKLGETAADALVRPARPGEPSALERLDEAEFQAVVSRMQGFVVSRQEAIFVEPDPAFFIALAQQAHDPASDEFFEAYRKTRPQGWPVYIERQTDHGGCLRYGTLSLVDTYKVWDAYRRKYPARYAQDVAKFLREIEDELTGGVCACDDKEAALREFTAFVRAYPHAKVSARLRERINQVREGKSGIREHCIAAG